MYKLITLGLLYISLVLFQCLVLTGGPQQLHAAAASTRQIQELHGSVEEGGRMVYTLNGLKQGDKLYAYMTSTGGNLDPLLGITKQIENADIEHDELLKGILGSTDDLLTSIGRSANARFLIWDDDSGDGYDAMLQFQVPEDGTYFLFVESTITNQTFNAFQPGFTSGSYRLLLGINAPEVAEGKAQSKGSPFAETDNRYVRRPAHVQHHDLKLGEKKLITFHHVKRLQPGDELFVRLESMDSSPLPRLFLSDFGSKPIQFGMAGEEENVVLLNYLSGETVDHLLLYVDASNIEPLPESVTYRLDVGINAPEVIKGEATEKGQPVFQQSKNVQIGLSVDQIANVDQQSENFTVVGSLQLTWQDPALAFSPDKCDCAIKKMELNSLKMYAVKKNILLPSFIFFNQQGNRWSQGQTVLIEPSGLTTYSERFTVTLQAPGFDFRAYPFDRQQFNIRIDLLLPTEVFMFQGVEQEDNALGNQLGEEEWSVVSYVQEVEAVRLSKDIDKSRFTMSLEVKRHLIYYIVRIITPLFLIITVSWVIFFLKDYGRQLEVASGNLLVFVAFNFTISNDLPRLGYLTLLDRMIITSFCCAALVVLISVCQKRLEAKGKKKLASQIDYIVLVSYPLVYVFLIAIEYIRVTSKIGT